MTKIFASVLLFWTSFNLHAESVDDLLKSLSERSKAPVAEKPAAAAEPSRGPASYRPRKKPKSKPAEPTASPAQTPAPAANTPPLDIPSNQAPLIDEEKSFSFAAVYKGDYLANTRGGVERKSVYIGNIDLKADINMEKLARLKGLRAFIYVMGQHGEDHDGTPGAAVGNLQLVDNIETRTDGLRLYEAYLEQTLLADKVSVLAGLHDLNSEFYVTDSTGVFLNPSFAIGPELGLSGANGPSIFPVTAPAVRVKMTPDPEFYMQFAVFNGQAGNPNETHGTVVRFNDKDGQLLVNEAGWMHAKAGEKGYAKVGIGTWSFTKPADHFYRTVTDSGGNTVPETATNHGHYFLSEYTFAKGATAFFKAGMATGEVNKFDSSLVTGLQFVGLIPHRENDRLGLGYIRAHGSGAYRESLVQGGSNPDNAESVFEVVYRLQVNDHLALQPDFQLIMNPGLDSNLEDAHVAGIRIEIGF